MRLDIVQPPYGGRMRSLEDYRDYLLLALHSAGVESNLHRIDWPEEGVPLFMGFDARADKLIDKPRIIVVTEVIGDDRLYGRNVPRDEAMEWWRSAAAVASPFPGNVAQLHKEGIPAVHLPYGYHEGMCRYEQAEEKDIDFFMVGVMNGRRARIIGQLEKYGKKVVDSGNYSFGHRRNAIISRTKVMPYPLFYDYDMFNQMRVGFLLNNGSLPVIEESECYRRLWPGCPLPVAPYKELVELMMFAVDHPCREELAAQAAQWWKERKVPPITEAVAQLLEQVGAA